MKKLLAILVLGLLWCNVGFAAWEILNPLPKKTGKDNDLYNIWIKDYNKFKGEWISEVFDFCNNQIVYGGGAQQLISGSKCLYQSAVGLAEKHKVHIPSTQTILYSWHSNLFSIAKASTVSILRGFNSNKIISDYVDREKELTRRLFSDLDKAIKEHASWDNAQYLAKKKKKKKEEGPKIDDNEILAASSGTGFFVSKAGLIVTNYHVTENCNSVKVIFKDTEEEAKILAVDKRNDLAIIKVNINPDKVYSVSNKDVSLMQDVIVAGFPLGKEISSAIKTHKGSVTALAGVGDNYSNFETDATINPGNSGGPIVDHKGNIVGVAVATWVEEGVQGIHFGIKSSTLKTFANANEITFLPASNREMSKEKLTQLVTDATVFLECWMTGAKIKKLMAQKSNRKAFYSKYK